MLGSEWLVRPVTEFGVREVTLYLPALEQGEGWVYYFNASVRFNGGANVTVSAPLEEVPLFRRVAPASGVVA